MLFSVCYQVSLGWSYQEVDGDEWCTHGAEEIDYLKVAVGRPRCRTEYNIKNGSDVSKVLQGLGFFQMIVGGGSAGV